MIDSRRVMGVVGLGLGAVLLGCGQVEASNGDPAPAAGGPDVSGRWAMFGWEDPVGVELHQRAGVLTGSGCGAGVPGARNAAYCASDLSGTIAGNSVKFDFASTAEILPGRYRADLVASADGTRMAGRFGVGDSLNEVYWFTWLRVPGNEFWLTAPADAPSFGDEPLDLRLSNADASDPSFDPHAVYKIAFRLDGLVGDFGSFFRSEMRRSNDGLVEAGPVSPTVPELPVYVAIARSGDAYTSVSARLSNGHTFTFDVLARNP